MNPCLSKSKAISAKEFPLSLGSSWADENIPLGQLRMALQATLDRAHSFLAQRNAFLIRFAAQLHDWWDAFPRHTFGPRQHRLDIKQLRPIPVQF